MARDADSRRKGADGPPSSVLDIGRALRRARTRQGLRFEDVAVRTGLAPDQLEALETGAVALIPDRVGIVKTLRRYADFLGLPGERFVLILVDAWPAPATTPTGATPLVGRGTETVVATGQSVRANPLSTTGPLSTSGQVTAIVPSSRSDPATGTDVTNHDPAGQGGWTTKQVDPVLASTAAHQVVREPGAFVDTGVNFAVAPPARFDGPVRRRAPRTLRILVAVVAVIVVLGVAALVIYRVKPHWFDTLGFNHSDASTTTSVAASSTTSETSPKKPADVTFTPTGPYSGTIDVTVPGTTVRIQAVGGTCWVSAATSDQSPPVFAQNLEPGTQHELPLGTSLTVQLGSSSGHAFVLQHGKVIGHYFPPTAPFTLTFQGPGA